MRISRKNRVTSAKSAMTLMEVVIAIGIVGFVVPIILTATASTTSSRLSAEADTRSAWLAEEVQQNLIAHWNSRELISPTPSGVTIPSTPFGPISSPVVFTYDANGNLLAVDNSTDPEQASTVQNAVYQVAVTAEAPPTQVIPQPPAPTNLIFLRIRVLHPAKSTSGNRSDLRYNVLTTREGTL